MIIGRRPNIFGGAIYTDRNTAGDIASAAKKVEEYNQQVENYTKQIHEKTTILNDLNNKINQATANLQKSAVDEQNLALSTSKLDKINANFKSNLMT